MKIKVELSDKGIEDAIKALEKEEKRSKTNDDLFMRKLAECGLIEAQKHFLEADENSELPDVYAEKTKNGYRIVASGTDVCFIEFGTGVYTGYGYEKTVNTNFAIRPGSWSKFHSRQFYVKGYWHYRRKKYVGTYPTKAMYLASKEMRQQIYQIAREVYRGD